MLQTEAFKRTSARREVWQFHFLRLSAYETAAHTSVTASLIFREPWWLLGLERRGRPSAFCLAASKMLHSEFWS